MSIRHVLVTGGAGYIGSHLVDGLIARGYQVTVLDALVPQVHRSGTWPSYANAKARYVLGDVRDRAVFEPLVLEADAVVHFAAAVSIGQSMYQIDRYVDVNTRGTALLLDISTSKPTTDYQSDRVAQGKWDWSFTVAGGTAKVPSTFAGDRTADAQ